MRRLAPRLRHANCCRHCCARLQLLDPGWTNLQGCLLTAQALLPLFKEYGYWKDLRLLSEMAFEREADAEDLLRRLVWHGVRRRGEGRGERGGYAKLLSHGLAGGNRVYNIYPVTPRRCHKRRHCFLCVKN